MLNQLHFYIYWGLCP